MPVRKKVTPKIENEACCCQPQRNGPSRFLIVALIIVSFFAGYLFFKVKSLEQKKTTVVPTPAQQVQQPSTTVSLDKVKALFKNGYLKFGDANKKLLFVEITDPSCPYCQIAAGKNPELSKQAGSRFQYVSDGGSYTPPVPEIKKLVDEGKASLVILFGAGHGNGRLGMQALYCAYEKNKFWELHDKLMNNAGYDLLNNKVQNDKKNIPQLVDFLTGEIDSNFLTSCLENGKYEKTLTRDEEIDPTLGFQGTPHFLVNTNIVNGAQDYKAFESFIKEALK